MMNPLSSILKPGMRVASLGYPDIIAPIPAMDGLKYRTDSEAICRRHGLAPRQIPDAESYFAKLGCELHVYDIVKERGCERLCDLNKPDELRYASKFYDIVLDVGTAEHVMNVFNAMMNMASMVKLGGYIIHENPHSGWGNHGFYSLHPTLFHDFYTSNGFEIVDCALVSRSGETAQVPATKRFAIQTQQDLNILCMAKRTEVVEFTYAQQTKYKKLLPAAGVPGEKTKEVDHARANVA